jgi:poly(A) polymerase
MNTENLALAIVKKIINNGYQAYFVGGWVRDFIMGQPSEDIDIASNAPPEKIMALFDHTIAVGASFGSIIVVLEGTQFEVSTFRTDGHYSNGRHPETITYSSPEEDAQRRDFTINGLFYDPIKKEFIDFVNGRKDIEHKIIRAIGDPNKRFQEDRLRMIRAVRFTTCLGFTLEEKTRQAIIDNAKTLCPSVAMERVWQELNKMAKKSRLKEALELMFEVGLLKTIFPELEKPLFKQMPEGCPTIFWVTELFPQNNPEKQLQLCDYLKVSNKEKKYVENLYLGKELSQQNEVEDYTWASFYSIDESQIILEIIGKDLTKHLQRRKKLHSHIQRIIEKKPLVRAKDLDIPPGKLLGKKLQEAERMAINSNIEDKELIIKLIKSS